MIHTSAACLCGGQKWKAGRIGQSGGMCRGSMRSIIPSLARVQVQMSRPSVHSLMVCWMVSGSPHRVKELVFVRWVVANLSFVGTMS